MASFYELTEDEVELLIEALDCLDSEAVYTSEEKEKAILELKEYLKTRERR